MIPNFEELPTANEAKAMSIQKTDSPDIVAHYILSSINAGRTFTTAYLDDDLVNKLTEKGYSVRKASLDHSYFIEW